MIHHGFSICFVFCLEKLKEQDKKHRKESTEKRKR
jgi:hypothetical protein